ncbi:hypothetical protein C0991_001801 [Blastosporella zonata]|nr:hypothetical protein C0991_001801 [Blastosporella zonata]
MARLGTRRLYLLSGNVRLRTNIKRSRLFLTKYLVGLESESRTLAKRMSAVSLSSQDDHFISMHTDPTAVGTYTIARDTPVSSFLQSNASATRNQFQQHPSRTSVPAKSNSRPVPNGNSGTPSNRNTSSPGPGVAIASRQRSRTYSQPYLPEAQNGLTIRPKTTKGSTYTNGKPSRSPDVRPTRIPQPSGRSPSLVMPTVISTQGLISPPPIPNGYVQYTTNPTTSQQAYPHAENGQRTPMSVPRSSSVNVNVNVGLGLLNEPPPFSPASASSSITHRSASPDQDPPRPSVESEERPFEHWYRGEVSRNGGVGELRVGRRQEMLEIANYGHTIRARERERREDKLRRRQRADSVSGIGDGSKERGSLHLDEEDAQRVGQVLDEAPLTDLEASEGGHHDTDEVYGHDQYDSDQVEQTWRQEDESTLHAGESRPMSNGTTSPQHADEFRGQEDEDTFDMGQSRTISNGAASPQFETASRTSHGTRSTTPTPATIQAQRPDSRSSRTGAQPSKIPARSRQSSESRVMTPTNIVHGASEPPSTPSPSHSPAPQSRQRQQQQQNKTPNGRAASKTRMQTGKARAKLLTSKKDMEEEAKRRSVAHYPTPGGEGDEMMIDAIPEWTQPVPRQGNWDDVVLPVVARKKGLDEHYQKAGGNPAPRPVNTTPAPAPGTFGYDRSKYRPLRTDGAPELIPMDEFGQHQPQPDAPPPEDEKPLPNLLYKAVINSHDQTQLPARAMAPSPAPFADYAPTSVPMVVTMKPDQKLATKHEQVDNRDDDGGGCCKCVIM